MPPRTTFALADRQKDSCLHPSRPKRNIIQKEKAGNAPSLAHEKGHRQTDRQTHRQTTTTLIASGPPLRGDPYFVCISTTLLRNNAVCDSNENHAVFLQHHANTHFPCTSESVQSCTCTVHTPSASHASKVSIYMYILSRSTFPAWQVHLFQT